MNSVALSRAGLAYVSVNVASLRINESDLNSDEKLRRGAEMAQFQFLCDTGATRTTILKQRLIDKLGYTEEYIADNKIILPDNEKLTLADGTMADIYKLPATRMTIGDYELQPEYIFTSDTIKNLRLLLGMDILRYFKFTFDFDAVDEGAPHGRMFYELRDSRVKPYTEMGEPFAYRLSESSLTETPF
jgi:predicted aspartyl protease